MCYIPSPNSRPPCWRRSSTGSTSATPAAAGPSDCWPNASATCRGCRLFRTRTDGEPCYYKVGFQYDAERFGLTRARFTAAVRAEGVALDEGFRALHVGRSPDRFRRVGSLAEAERAHAGCVVLHHPVLLGSDEEVGQVAEAVLEGPPSRRPTRRDVKNTDPARMNGRGRAASGRSNRGRWFSADIDGKRTVK